MRQLALTLGMALGSLTAQAQTPELAPVISIGSRAEQPLREVAGSVSLIEIEQLEQRLSTDLASALRYEPGVSVPTDAVRFGAGSISIRGLSGNRVGMHIDGIPVGESFAVGSFSNADRGSLETAFLSRIELLRGPASTLYGSDALGGVLSLRTLGPAELLAERESERGGRQRVVSDEGRHWLTSSVLAGQSGDLDWLAGLAWRTGSERDNQPRPGGLRSNPADSDGRTALFKLGLDRGWAGRYQLQAEQLRESVDTDLRSFVRGLAQYASTTDMQGEDALLRQRLGVSASFPYTLPGLEQLRLQLWDSRSRADQRTLQTREAAGRTPASLRDRRFVYKDHSQGLNLGGEGRFGLGESQHWQVFGLDLSRTRLNEHRDGLETRLDTGAVSNTIIGEVFPVRDFPPTTVQELGIYWQDEIRFGASGLSLIPGLRHERFDLDARPDVVYLDDNPGLAIADLQASATTAKLGARFDYSDHGQLFAQYAQGFRAPPPADLNIGFTIPAFNYTALPNPALRPEHSRGLELGWRYSGAIGSTEIVAFRNRYTDLIESRVNLGRDPESGALVFQSQNRAAARIEGVEARADLTLPWAGFGTQIAAAWARGDDTALGVPLNSIEPARLSLGVSYDSPDGRQRIELVGTAMAAKRRLHDPEGNLFRTPGLLRLDAFYRFRPSERLILDVGLFNLSNRRIWNWSSVAGLTADAREIDLYTEGGRRLGASLRFDW
ncbi:MAG: TonB-dependent receptor [Lysobacterales bacterium]